MWNKLKEILQDNSGGISSIRLFMLIWGVGALLVWGSASFVVIVSALKAKAVAIVLPTLPGEVVTVLLGITGCKAMQRFGEKDSTPPPPV